MRKRLFYLTATLVLLAVEIFIGLFVHDGFVRPFIGDVLVVILIYTFIRIFIPEKVRLLPLYVFIFSVAVEILQYFRIVEVLGLQDNRFFSTVIGTSFDIRDILCYFVGCALCGIWEYLTYRKNKAKTK
ncbi:MAG: DUF2809 domain-containing protein [Clostridiales bacterium]|nr:DUF2809 domain-containing protein [Clostridiales bacterium]